MTRRAKAVDLEFAEAIGVVQMLVSVVPAITPQQIASL
jgi:hypothetical protein